MKILFSIENIMFKISTIPFWSKLNCRFKKGGFPLLTMLYYLNSMLIRSHIQIEYANWICILTSKKEIIDNRVN